MSTTDRLVATGTAMLVAACGLYVLAAPAFAQDHAGQYEQADIEFGAQLYASHCTTCHGEDGDLMPQINLRTGQFPNAANDRELGEVIRDGLAGTAMIATNYNDSEIAALIAYVRNITTVNLESIRVGDAERGRSIYLGKGDCDSCHRIRGDGPRAAPDLTSIGALRTAATLQRKLHDPEASLLPINRPVRAVADDGTVINGRRINEDTFTVQLIDTSGQLVSLDKTTLREYSISAESTMPRAADILSDEELADVLAYLLTLKGIN